VADARLPKGKVRDEDRQSRKEKEVAKDQKFEGQQADLREKRKTSPTPKRDGGRKNDSLSHYKGRAQP